MRAYLTPLILGLGGIAILISLGVWQLQRLDWKETAIARIEAVITATPGAIPPAPTAADTYMPVTATGDITGDEIHILVSRKNIGPGYRIITAFDVAGRRVLLDRGFIPLEAKDTPRAPRTMTVTGNLLWPDDMTSSTPAPDLGANIWFGRDVAALAAALKTEPTLIIARSDTGDDIFPLPVDTASIPNDHLQYAITWFSLAAVWLGMTVYMMLGINSGRRKRN